MSEHNFLRRLASHSTISGRESQKEPGRKGSLRGVVPKSLEYNRLKQCLTEQSFKAAYGVYKKPQKTTPWTYDLSPGGHGKAQCLDCHFQLYFKGIPLLRWPDHTRNNGPSGPCYGNGCCLSIYPDHIKCTCGKEAVRVTDGRIIDHFHNDGNVTNVMTLCPRSGQAVLEAIEASLYPPLENIPEYIDY